MKKVIVNKSGTIQWRDFLKSWFLFAAVPVLTFLQEWASSEDIETALDWKALLKVAISASVAYMMQQAISPAKVITTYDSNEQAKRVAEKIESEAA